MRYVLLFGFLAFVFYASGTGHDTSRMRDVSRKIPDRFSGCVGKPVGCL